MRALMRSELRALIGNCKLLHTIPTWFAEIHFQGAKLSSELKSHPKATILPLLAPCNMEEALNNKGHVFCRNLNCKGNQNSRSLLGRKQVCGSYSFDANVSDAGKIMSYGLKRHLDYSQDCHNFYKTDGLVSEHILSRRSLRVMYQYDFSTSTEALFTRKRNQLRENTQQASNTGDTSRPPSLTIKLSTTSKLYGLTGTNPSDISQQFHEARKRMKVTNGTLVANHKNLNHQVIYNGLKPSLGFCNPGNDSTGSNSLLDASVIDDDDVFEPHENNWDIDSDEDQGDGNELDPGIQANETQANESQENETQDELPENNDGNRDNRANGGVAIVDPAILLDQRYTEAKAKTLIPPSSQLKSEIELMNIIRKHKMPLEAFKSIQEWAKKCTTSFKHKFDQYEVRGRNTVLKEIADNHFSFFLNEKMRMD